MPDELVRLLATRKGHFRLESGHHGDLWLDLDALWSRPGRLRRFAADLAERLSRHHVAAVCGPLVGGAFLAQLVAAELNVAFYYAERVVPPHGHTLFPMGYRIPNTLRFHVRGKETAVVDDVINAGSAIRATLADLQACGARPVAISALLVLGSSASSFAAQQRLPLESISHLPNRIWLPLECPLCVARVPLEDAAGPSPGPEIPDDPGQMDQAVDPRNHPG